MRRSVVMRSSNAIVQVVQACLDDERTLLRGSKLVDAKKRAVLMRMARERRRFSAELERLNREPLGRGHAESWRALLREIGEWLYPYLWGANPGDVIDACRRSQHRADARYEKALTLDWPHELKAALEMQHERVHAARGELSAIEY